MGKGANLLRNVHTTETKKHLLINLNQNKSKQKATNKNHVISWYDSIMGARTFWLNDDPCLLEKFPI